jgi:hypothetical protein
MKKAYFIHGSRGYFGPKIGFAWFFASLTHPETPGPQFIRSRTLKIWGI